MTIKLHLIKNLSHGSTSKIDTTFKKIPKGRLFGCNPLSITVGRTASAEANAVLAVINKAAVQLEYFPSFDILKLNIWHSGTVDLWLQFPHPYHNWRKTYLNFYYVWIHLHLQVGI